jgi:tyrosine-specific transport protein
MKQLIGSICLVAGTSIGVGTLALPITLSQLGIINTFWYMAMVWGIMYFSAIASLELNLRAGKGLPLGNLGKHFSGRIAQLIGNISLILLMYALLAAYFSAGTSVTYKILDSLGLAVSKNFVNKLYILVNFVILCLHINWIDQINRVLFYGLVAIMIIVSGAFLMDIDPGHLPLWQESAGQLKSWAKLTPVMFTAFGFQVIFHTLTNYCNKDKVKLKRAFFWGSLLTALIYLLWTGSILGVLYKHNPTIYEKMLSSNIDVAELMTALSSIIAWSNLRMLFWIIVSLAVITSFIGVGIGLSTALESIIHWPKNTSVRIKYFLSTLLAVTPAYFVATNYQDIFINALSFAGMILAVIALILPLYLLIQSNKQNPDVFYKITTHPLAISFGFIFAFWVIGCEIFNLIR